MLCQRCNKEKATLHYTKNINGNIEEIHLCEGCSKNSDEFETTFSIHKLLTGIIDSLQEEGFDSSFDDLYCSKCKLTYREFKQEGKLACDKCYDSFRLKLEPLIRGIQGKDRHLGKIPKRANKNLKLKREIERLRQEIDLFILEEKFEKAALARDRIRELEVKLLEEGE